MDDGFGESESGVLEGAQEPSVKLIDGVTVEEIIEEIKNIPLLYELYERNNDEAKERFVKGFMKVPSRTDGPGFIYGFIDEQENVMGQIPYWIKIGRTSKSVPQNRIYEWEKADMKKLTELFTVRSLYNIKLEGLVHALFSYARKNRYINEKKRIQWFRFEEKTLNATTVTLINHLMENVHEKYIEKKVSKRYRNKSMQEISQMLSEINRLQRNIEIILRQNYQNLIKQFKISLTLSSSKHNDELPEKITNQADASILLNSLSEGKPTEFLIKEIEEYQKTHSLFLTKITETKETFLNELNTYLLKKKQEQKNLQAKQVQNFYEKENDEETRVPEQMTGKIDKKKSQSFSIPPKTEVEKIEKVKNIYEIKEPMSQSKLDKYLRKKQTIPRKSLNKTEDVNKKNLNSSETTPSEIIERMSMQRLSEIQDYANKNSVQHYIVNLCQNDFYLDMKSFNPRFSLVILCKSLIVQQKVIIFLQNYEKQLSIFCRQIKTPQNILINGAESNFKLLKVTDSEKKLYQILDKYHLEYPQKLKADFINKMLTGFRNYIK